MAAISDTLRSGRCWRRVWRMVILFYIYHYKRFACKGRLRKRWRGRIERQKHIFAWCNWPRSQWGGKGVRFWFRMLIRLLIVSRTMLLWMKFGRLNRSDVFYYVFVVSGIFVCFWNITMFFVMVVTKWSNKHLAMMLFTVIGSSVSTITTQLLEKGALLDIHIYRERENSHAVPCGSSRR